MGCFDCISCVDCDFIDRIKRWLCSDHCSYHPPTNDTVDHSKKIADELAEMKEKARTDGKKIGNETFENINFFMKNFLEDIKKINTDTYGGKQLNIKIDVIEKEIAKLRDEVTDFVGNRMDERLVTTDKELSVILAEENDKKREHNFDEFYVRIHKQAVLDLTKKVEEVIARQFVLIDDEIKSRLNDVNADMKKAMSSYEEMNRILEEKDTALASRQVECMYTISVSDIVCDELKSVAEK